MSLHRVLLLGGNGKIARFLTPLLLRRSWTVTSIVRDPNQVPELQKLGEKQPGTLSVLVRSIEEVKSEAQARSIINEANPDYIVWSAGAGGKGGPERTFAIDRDAAVHFIRAAVSTPSVTRFLMVSHLGSRREKPAWWPDEAWQHVREVNTTSLATYYQAKLVPDEVLYEIAKANNDFVAINLRPGRLSLDPAAGVELGKTKGTRGIVSREGVARVADLLLAKGQEEFKNTNVWLDLLDGDEDPEAAVDRVAREGVNAAEGEPVFYHG